ncbi:MAG TPA: PD-(D/E)XK nuclease family protein, partial [Rhodocyclaceae bacterium]|nr:PD-(D/E)XK nuclease family protein [Rhodocyclaceae bacterium]
MTGARAPQRPAGLPSSSWQTLIARTQALIARPELAMFFSDERYTAAHNEVEFALPDGTVGRIDRLVEHADVIWGVDYKTGAPAPVALDTYAAQLSRYR